MNGTQMNCCDEFCSSHGCNQGRDCPVRIARETREDVESIYEVFVELLKAGLLAFSLFAVFGLSVYYFLQRWV